LLKADARMNTKLYLALSLLANAVLGFYAFRPATPVVAPAAAPAPAAATPGKPAAAQPRTAIQKVTNMVTCKRRSKSAAGSRM
jgi:hypothetical protein